MSIIIPTRDGKLLQRCIDSVLAFTTYPNFEIVVVDNSSRDAAHPRVPPGARRPGQGDS